MTQLMREQMIATLQLLGWEPYMGGSWINKGRRLYAWWFIVGDKIEFRNGPFTRPANAYIGRRFGAVTDRDLRWAYDYLVTL